jgi:hypothetical protein
LDWRACALASSRWAENSLWKHNRGPAPDYGRHFKLPTLERKMRDLIRIGATCDHPLLHPVPMCGLAQMAVE